MKTMIIMIGIQGSGKSEFCLKKLGNQFVRVNLDTLRTRNNERRLIENCLVEAKDFVVDNTNPTAADRNRYLQLAKENGYHVIGYFMQSNLKDCIARNNTREGKAKVPSKAIAATSNKLEMPTYDEGFDELYYVANNGVTMTVSEWRDKE